MVKTIDDYFSDWGHDMFGSGYGTGEAFTLQALKEFCELLDPSNSLGGGFTYSHVKLEASMNPTVAWLLIEMLGRELEYGTSPRYGWTTPSGTEVAKYVRAATVDHLYEVVACHDVINEGYIPCYPDGCNCDEQHCANPFWFSTY